MDEATRRKEESRNPHGGRHIIGRHLRLQLGCNDSLNLLETGPCHLQIIVPHSVFGFKQLCELTEGLFVITSCEPKNKRERHRQFN